MTPTAKQATEHYAASVRRADAFAAGFHTAKGTLGALPLTYERLRERYARGSISLEAFETEVELLLRMSARLTEMGEPA